MRQQSGLQAREEGQQMSAPGEVDGRTLDTVLSNQHDCPAAVRCVQEHGNYLIYVEFKSVYSDTIKIEFLQIGSFL